jgi:hypothetical protein
MDAVIKILLTIFLMVIYNKLNQKPVSIEGVVLTVGFIWGLVLV